LIGVDFLVPDRCETRIRRSAAEHVSDAPDAETDGERNDKNICDPGLRVDPHFLKHDVDPVVAAKSGE
jgi:hypothetical protein